MTCLSNRLYSWDLHFGCKNIQVWIKAATSACGYLSVHVHHKLCPYFKVFVSFTSCFSSGIPIRWTPLLSSLQFYSSWLTYSLHFFSSTDLLIFFWFLQGLFINVFSPSTSLSDQENSQRFPILATGKKHHINASSAVEFIQVLQQIVNLSADALKSKSSLVVAPRQGQHELLTCLKAKQAFATNGCCSSSPEPL